MRWAAGGVTRTGNGIGAMVSPFATGTSVESWTTTGHGSMDLGRYELFPDGPQRAATGAVRERALDVGFVRVIKAFAPFGDGANRVPVRTAVPAGGKAYRLRG